MKRRKTKINNKFLELFDESATITLKKQVSKETEEFLQKYSYITFDNRLSSEARVYMLTILTFPENTIVNASLIKTTSSESKAEIEKALEELEHIGYIKEIDSSTGERAYIRNVE